MDVVFFPTNRFERLRRVIAKRRQMVKDMEREVIASFEAGDLEQIKQLMKKKDRILSMNNQLLKFIDKWEKSSAEIQDQQLHTSN